MRAEYKASFKIAETGFNIRSCVPFEKLRISENLFKFSTSEYKEDNSILVNVDEVMGELAMNEAEYYNPGDIWKLYKEGKKISAVIYDHKSRPKCQIIPSKKWENNKVNLKFYGDEDRSIIDSGALELIFRTYLGYRNGVMMHSSLVDDNGKGILFTGNSGEGKSTTSGFWKGLEGASIINEDRNALRINHNGIIAYGTPWGGTAKNVLNKNVKLNAIILIKKSGINKIEEMPSSVAVPLLITRSFFPYWDNELAGMAVENISSIVSKVPVYMLHCRPEKEVVDLVRSVLQ